MMMQEQTVKVTFDTTAALVLVREINRSTYWLAGALACGALIGGGFVGLAWWLS